MTTADEIVREANPRRPGEYTVAALRATYEALRDNLSELKEVDTPKQMAKLAENAHNCTCALTACAEACPKGKDVPTLMTLLRDVDFEILTDEFGEVMEKLDAFLEDFRNKTIEDYAYAMREGYLNVLNKAVAEKGPEFQAEFNKLKKAIKKQLSYSLQAKFTGMACPAPCEGGTELDKPGCTLRTEFTSPVSIKSTERIIAELAEALGVFDEICEAIGNKPQKPARVDIIGAGPAGLQAAEEYRRQGFEVHVWDNKPEIGGVMYHGVPNHKIDKGEFALPRMLMERKAGINFHLGAEVTAEHPLFGETDLVILAVGGMDGRHERLPTDVAGWESIANNPRVMPAYDAIVASTEATVAGAVRPPANMKVVFGAGDTSEDDVRTSARNDTQAQRDWQADAVISEAQGHLLKIDRNPIPPPERLRGQGYGARPTTSEQTSLSREMDETGYNTIYGAEASQFIENNDGTIDVVLKFRKPVNGRLETDKQYLSSADYQQDSDVGAIRNDAGEVIGIRLRDAFGKLHDFANIGNNKFALNETEGGIAGKVDGSFTIHNVDELTFAFGTPKFAYKNPLLIKLGLVDGNGLTMNDNGTTTACGKPAIIVGDASGAQQLIVSAQGDASNKLNIGVGYLNGVASARHGGGELSPEAATALWSKAELAPATMGHTQRQYFRSFEQNTGWGTPVIIGARR